MADDNQEQNTQEAPVSRGEFQGFMHSLGGHLNQLAAQQQALLAAQQQAAAPPPEEPDLPPDFDRSMAMEMLRRPRDYSRKVIEAATQQASQVIEQRLSQEYEKARDAASANKFWSEFYAANPDLQQFHGEILANFNNTPPSENPSVRANYARDVVRQKLAQVAGSHSDADARQRAARQMAGGAPGSAPAPITSGPEGGYDRSRSPSEMTDDYFIKRAEQQAARRGDQLRNDREYWEEMRQATLRRVRDTGGRKGKAA